MEYPGLFKPESSLCEGAEALSNPVAGGTKKVANRESKVKVRSDPIRLVRASETNYGELHSRVCLGQWFSVVASGLGILPCALGCTAGPEPPCSRGVPEDPDSLGSAPRASRRAAPAVAPQC